MNQYITEQENFWAGNFGDDYIERNQSKELLSQNLKFFVTALKQTDQITSCIEYGANIGMNINALKLLLPDVSMHAVEINKSSANKLKKIIEPEKIFTGSIFDFKSEQLFDLSLIKTVLIHINPAMLPIVYDKLYKYTKKYILICEYYNPDPVMVEYRGHNDKLFKRDFCGEMLDRFDDLTLVDYGFGYHRRDPLIDDISWFLLKKNS